MEIKRKVKGLGAAVAAVALASSMFAGSALADQGMGAYVPTSQASAGTYITGAATRAAMPSVEILGLASVEESGQFMDTTYDLETQKYTNVYDSTWYQPKYWLAASNIQAHPSPYLVNLAGGYGTATTANAAGDRAMFLSTRTGTGNGPNKALGSTIAEQTLAGMADIEVGNGALNFTLSTGATSYGAKDYSQLVKSMDEIVERATPLLATKTTRCTATPAAIAQDYEEYIFGTIGYIQEQLDDGADIKTVALVENYKVVNNVGYYDLMLNSEAGDDGTAATNRYLETTTKSGNDAITLAENYADVLNDDENNTYDVNNLPASVFESAVNSGAIDLVLVGGQQSSQNYGNIIGRLETAGLLEKTFFVKDNGAYGSMYGTTMNSVENAQNVGRILGMLYPEYVNQQSWMAYYYETFYHVDSSLLPQVMGNALDGVRCYNTQLGTSTEEDASEWPDASYYIVADDDDASYPKSKVEGIISDGYDYYLTL